ncbi:PREDICTED: 5'-nucleotidase domain-containing protein 4-like isoform X2 [Nelumbo nucifera]|uniref:5'-nucleotidase domain-containing protein 4-like isoform X2 n=1 Tax=Nelumbo nucifera TaxID=4432 RepID=A0A1U8ADS6_NELNU|nr:PREDICTED: 5'-nucleotidase domain-containing protein 4-like isoform X2 [Nelumbo nucifera]
MSPPISSSSSSSSSTTATTSRATTFQGTDSIYPLTHTAPRCIFKFKMRISKRPFSICLSILSLDLSPPFASGIGFNSGVLGSRLISGVDCPSLRRRRGIFNLGGFNRFHTNNIMDGMTSQYQHPISNDAAQDRCIWSSHEGGHKIDIGKQIFCNRSLNMKNIVAVGFDMDYTLAQYMPETFESLAYNGTTRKLVYDLGYPPELLEWSFDWKYMVRGLVLDKKRGNILKMDRHKYVKVAYHGFREMSKEDKIATYGNTLLRDSFDEPDYALIDTLFSLAEAYLFAQLVDFKDNNPGKVPNNADYSRMYKDVRAAVDLCHRDGTLKQMVAKDPKKYINEDPSIVPMIKMLRDSGRATFLVTNSLWDYTNVVMNFLCGNQTTDGIHSCNYSWLENFDVVITGSSKPSFFHEDNRANLFEVEPESGMLLNTDNGTPVPQIGNSSPRLPSKESKKACRVFQGGSVGHLHKLLSIEASSQVLYIGDHIYGDILRSKKVLGWRTMLVVPELEREVELLWESRETRKQLRLLRKERDLVEDKIHHLKWSLKFKDVSVDEKQNFLSELEELESQREEVRLRHQQAQRSFHQWFHKVWGQLMKTGYQNSRFAHQVERFACLYTSQVTNLSLYSPDKYYRPSEDFMPHEFDILTV